MTAGGDNPDAFEDLINGYVLRVRWTALHHGGDEPVAQNEDRMLCETFKQLRRDMKATTLTSVIGGAKMPLKLGNVCFSGRCKVCFNGRYGEGSRVPSGVRKPLMQEPAVGIP